MQWSLKIARVAGIRIYVHFTFFILLAWVTLSQYVASGKWEHAAAGFVFFACLAGIIVLHELGHALAAKRYGVRTRDITLLPIGGIARLDRIPERPAQELVIALAGPAVNVVLAAGLFVGMSFGRGPAPVAELAAGGGTILDQLLWVNVALVVFNLLPAFPMDGGRVLRALLAMRMPYVDATRAAAHVGQGMAVLFGLVGLLFNPMLVLIAAFVWFGAAAEAEMVRTKSALTGVTVAEVMATHFQTLAPEQTLVDAADAAIHGFQHDFPVVEDGQLVGMLVRGDLIAALAESRSDAPIRNVMDPEFRTAHPSDSMERAVARLRRGATPALPVTAGGQLVGLLTAEQIAEFLALRESMGIRPGRPDNGPDDSDVAQQTRQHAAV